MNIDELLRVLETARGFPLTPEQESIVRHPNGPAWVLAGPGTGKTEVLTVMLLRLLYVDGDSIQTDRTAPESIFLTTFTEKAARNLEDRLSAMRTLLVNADASLAAIDISKLNINTLHGLCNDLLQEHRAPNYQNVRLMDDFEQGMFIHQHMDIVKRPMDARDLPFWRDFSFLFPVRVWQASYRNCPRKWAMAKALATVFNRLAEDRINIAALRGAGPQMNRLADLYEEYHQKLVDHFRCDFAHLQVRFLEFLNSQVGQAFCDGADGAPNGIQWVLVDEYQDTNRIQEEIYMTLANRGNRNIVVVGDDDQAMYRFRGGSVECMVTFDDAIQALLGLPKSSVVIYPLATNFRSHPDIVDFCDNYINAFPIMSNPGARVPGKPSLSAGSAISGTYTAVATIETKRVADLHDRFALTVEGLIRNGIVSDPNQCCLLLKSTKETPRNAGPYVAALKNRGLAVYNPRNKAFLEQEEVQVLLGALLAIVDHNHTHVPIFQTGARAGQLQYELLQGCWDAYVNAAAMNTDLQQYVDRVSTRIRSKPPGTYFDSTLHEIVYLLLGLEPFRTWQADTLKRQRLGRLTHLIESFSAMPVANYPGLSRGTLRTSQRSPGELVAGWVRQFYHLFFGYLNETGFDDIEDDEVICPPGMVPVMTIHQSKGLEFPFVFVGHADATASPSSTHELEDLLAPFPTNTARVFSRSPAAERAQLDLIRQYFVAYSRAQYALIILGGGQHLRKGAIPCGPTKNWLRRNSLNI